MDNLNVIPETITREDHYLKFLAVGGDINLLPEPVSRRDNFLYAMCLNGGNIGVSSKRVDGFYRCLLNSQAGGQNFCTGILDLGEKRVTTAKARFRFTLKRDTGTALPTAIGIRLFANNSPGRDIVAGYTKINDNMITNNIAENKEYVIEGIFTDNSVPLNECKYLKPYLTFTKGSDDPTFNIKHLIDLHEISIEVNGKVFDITDTVSDFAAQGASNITYIENAISEQGLAIRKAPWFGKTVACLGDSITFGMRSGQTSQTAKEDNPWVSQLKNYSGFTNIRNYGISGSTVSNVSGKNPMFSRYTTMDNNADIVIVMGGTNDIAGNVPLGDFDPTGATVDTNNFYGALNVLYKGLKEKYPNKPIVVMTPLNAVNSNLPGGVSTGLNLTMEDYRVAIRNVAKLYGFYIIELQDLVGFNALVDEDKPKYITDGVHPNQAGHDIMAKVISKFINQLA